MLTPKTRDLPLEVSEPTLYSSMIAQANFHMATNHVSNRLLNNTPPTVGESLILNGVLESWSHTLPSYFRLNQPLASSEYSYTYGRCRLWWRYWNMQIILFRPILLRATAEMVDNEEVEIAKARDICIHSAHSTIHSVNDFIRNNHVTKLASWYSL